MAAYRNGSDDDIERVDRRSTEFFSPDGNFEFIEYDQVPPVPESDSSGSQAAPLSEREQSEENSAGDSDSQRRCESAHDGTGTTAGNNETAAFAPHENGGTTAEQSGDTDGVWEKRDPTTAIPAPNIPDDIPPLPQEHNCGSVSAMTEQEEAQWDWETKAKEILDSGRPSSHLELALHYEHRGLFYFGPGGAFELSIFNGGISLARLPECQVRFPVAPNRGAARTVFRGERSSRSPDIVFEQGLQPKSTNTDLLRHVTSNTPDTNFIATSIRPRIAKCFAGKNGYVYVIRSKKGVDINVTLGSKSPFPEQFEVAIPGGISNVEVMGAFKMRKGEIIGDFIRNPNFRKP